MKLRFVVQGSAQEPYVVIVEINGASVTATCDCQGALHGRICKHRVSILSGSTKGVIDGDVEQISQLPAMVAATDVGAALRELAIAEDKAAIAKRRLASAKKALLSAMTS